MYIIKTWGAPGFLTVFVVCHRGNNNNTDLRSASSHRRRKVKRTMSGWSRIALLVLLSSVLLGESQEVNSERREFHSYLPPEEGKSPEYQIFQYPPQGYPHREDYLECGRNPMIPLLGKGLNLLLLKLGVFGIIKAVMALVFVAFLAKLPLLLLKVAFLKSFFFPLLVAPLLLHLFTTQMAQPAEGPSTPDAPGDPPAEVPAMQAINDMAMAMGRQLNDNLTSVAWQSIKMFVESDQCVERISCVLGASSKDSSFGPLFTRTLKYLHHSSPPSLRERMTVIREAFSNGRRTSTCPPEDFKCDSPELMLQYGGKRVRIL